MEEQRLPTVFISYVTENEVEVERLRTALERFGVEPWGMWRHCELGPKLWADAIGELIGKTDFFIPCFSQAYAAKCKRPEGTYVNEEIEVAIQRQRRVGQEKIILCPVRFDKTEVAHFEVWTGKYLDAKFQRFDLHRAWESEMMKLLQFMGVPSIPSEDVRHAVSLLRTAQDSELVVGALRQICEARYAPAAELVAGKLKHAEPRVKAEAATALAALGDESALPVLEAALVDQDPRVRKCAVYGMSMLGQLGISALIRALEDDDWFVRASAALALGESGVSEAAEPLIVHLDDPNDEVCRACAYALAMLGAPLAVGSLVRSLQHRNLYVRLRSAEALVYIGTPEAIAAVEDAGYDVEDVHERINHDFDLGLGDE